MTLDKAIAAADQSMLEIPYIVAALHSVSVGCYCVWIICCQTPVNHDWYYISITVTLADSVDNIQDRILDHWYEAKPVARLYGLMANGGPVLDWDLYTLTAIRKASRKQLPILTEYHRGA